MPHCRVDCTSKNYRALLMLITFWIHNFAHLKGHRPFTTYRIIEYLKTGLSFLTSVILAVNTLTPRDENSLICRQRRY